MVYFVSRILCPPLSDRIHKNYRKRHFESLQEKIFDGFEEEFWNPENLGKSMRVSASHDDYHLAYFDFINLRTSNMDQKEKALNTKAATRTILLAGAGTYNSPYQVDFKNDPMAAKYLLNLIKENNENFKDSLPLFFYNLNTLLGKLSFFKFESLVMRDLTQVLDWIELGNKSLFRPLKV